MKFTRRFKWAHSEIEVITIKAKVTVSDKKKLSVKFLSGTLNLDYET